MNARTLSRAQLLPTQPLIAAAVLAELAKENEVELTPLAEIDPSLTIAVMAAANAPHLRQARRVASVRQAMVLLGANAVEAIATCRTAALVLGPDDVGFPTGYWVRSITAAAASAVLAGRLGLNVDEAFTCGLLHDVGDLLLYRGDPEMHAVVASRIATNSRPILATEKSMFGRTHVEVGADQLERWFFPERIVRAVRSHHAPAEALTDSLSRVVWGGHRLGAVIAGQPQLGAGEVTNPTTVLKVLGLGSESPDRILSDADRRVNAIIEIASRDRS